MKRLVLLGGGHSHVEVIRRFAASPPEETRVVLVSTEPQMVYSGMLPGFVAGHYSFSDCHIELGPLCRAARVEFRRASAVDIDPAARVVRCSDGAHLHYDVLSVNIGATPQRDAISGARDLSVPVKPLTRFVASWHGIAEDVRSSNAPFALAIVGAGAGGVELALAMQHALCPVHKRDHRIALHLLTDMPTILPDHAAPVRRKLERILRERGIYVHTGDRVTSIRPGLLQREHGAPLPVRHALLTTNAAAPAWLAHTGLNTDDRGFILVNEALQSHSHPQVFAAGDVASIEPHALPKSGVYAVRQGPPLAENLRRALASRPLVAYSPQRSTLALISTGNRYAVASWRGLALEGKWVWRWKDRIDRRFIAKYRIGNL